MRTITAAAAALAIALSGCASPGIVSPSKPPKANDPCSSNPPNPSDVKATIRVGVGANHDPSTAPRDVKIKRREAGARPPNETQETADDLAGAGDSIGDPVALGAYDIDLSALPPDLVGWIRIRVVLKDNTTFQEDVGVRISDLDSNAAGICGAKANRVRTLPVSVFYVFARPNAGRPPVYTKYDILTPGEPIDPKIKNNG